MRTAAAIALILGATCCAKPAQTPKDSAHVDVAALSARGSMGTNGPHAPPHARSDVAVPHPSARANAKAREKALSLPSAFQGHWGLATVDCDISRPDAPGLMKVHGDRIDFHDASAVIRAIVERHPYRIVADLDYATADGTRPRRDGFALRLGGTRLARSEAGRTTTYEKC